MDTGPFSHRNLKNMVDIGWLQDGNSCSIAMLYQLPPPNWHQSVGCPLGEVDFADRVTYGRGCGRRRLPGAGSIQD